MRMLSAIALLFAALPALAIDSPAGLWRIDDSKGHPDALVRIYDNGGVFFGRFEKIFNPDPVRDRCTACTDERRNQPLLGMVFLSDFKPEGDHYAGRVLNPETGKIYRCNLRVVAGGAKLEVRGFIGISALGRTQLWSRYDEH